MRANGSEFHAILREPSAQPRGTQSDAALDGVKEKVSIWSSNIFREARNASMCNPTGASQDPCSITGNFESTGFGLHIPEYIVSICSKGDKSLSLGLCSSAVWGHRMSWRSAKKDKPFQIATGLCLGFKRHLSDYEWRNKTGNMSHKVGEKAVYILWSCLWFLP